MASTLALAVGLALPVLAMGSSNLPIRSSDIVGGTVAALGDFPYIVSLSKSSSHFCGGVLVNANTVLTAAHCSVGQTASTVKVRAGTLVSLTFVNISKIMIVH